MNGNESKNHVFITSSLNNSQTSSCVGKCLCWIHVLQNSLVYRKFLIRSRNLARLYGWWVMNFRFSVSYILEFRFSLCASLFVTLMWGTVNGNIIGKDLESLDRSTNRTATFQESARSMLHVTDYWLKTIGTDEIDVINSNSYTLLLVCRSKGHFVAMVTRCNAWCEIETIRKGKYPTDYFTFVYFRLFTAQNWKTQRYETEVGKSNNSKDFISTRLSTIENLSQHLSQGITGVCIWTMD